MIFEFIKKVTGRPSLPKFCNDLCLTWLGWVLVLHEGHPEQGRQAARLCAAAINEDGDGRVCSPGAGPQLAQLVHQSGQAPRRHHRHGDHLPRRVGHLWSGSLAPVTCVASVTHTCVAQTNERQRLTGEAGRGDQGGSWQLQKAP